MEAKRERHAVTRRSFFDKYGALVDNVIIPAVDGVHSRMLFEDALAILTASDRYSVVFEELGYMCGMLFCASDDGGALGWEVLSGGGVCVVNIGLLDSLTKNA